MNYISIYFIQCHSVYTYEMIHYFQIIFSVLAIPYSFKILHFLSNSEISCLMSKDKLQSRINIPPPALAPTLWTPDF